MKTVSIIQARMSSKRLPGKVLADIADKPMLWHVVGRARLAKTLDQVVLATSDQAPDDAIAGFCAQNAIECFRGSEEDVLDRFYQAAKRYRAEVIVRLTADCPLLDPVVIDRVVSAFREGQPDYASNTINRSYPDGLDAEVFTFNALERAWHEAVWQSEREHVTPFIWKHPELFRIGHVRQDTDLSALRWTVDEQEDLDFVRSIYSSLGSVPFGMAEMLDYLLNHPEVSEVNAKFACNEGYRQSVREDKVIIIPETR